MIASDGEGATRLLEVQVQGAESKEDARRIAKNIVESPLVKTAIHGADPNWGRIIAAAGKDPACRLDPHQLELYLQGHLLFSQGAPHPDCPRESIIPLLKENEVKIVLKLNAGVHAATAWGCDLSRAYIEINTCYN